MPEISVEITKAMQQYSGEVAKAVEQALTETAEEARKQLAAASPKRSGKYARGWKVKKTTQFGEITVEVHQSGRNASLTHLLEKGHRTRSKKGWVKAQPHIAPVEAWAQSAAEAAIEKAVKG